MRPNLCQQKQTSWILEDRERGRTEKKRRKGKTENLVMFHVYLSSLLKGRAEMMEEEL